MVAVEPVMFVSVLAAVTAFKVSSSMLATLSPPVAAVMFTVSASAEPLTPVYVSTWSAALSEIDGVTAVVMPLKVVVAVLVTELTLVTPVALVRFKVAAVVTVALTISIPVMVIGVRLAISVAVMVSVPAPPASASLACHV